MLQAFSSSRMLVPTYWAEARRQHRAKGRQVTVRRFGWSDLSQPDAQVVAELRAADALERILAGAALPRRDPKVPYNGAAGVPIREEIIARGDDGAILTRNLYGALCLNTPNVLFADVDFELQVPGRWILGALATMALVAVALPLAAGLHGGYVLLGLLLAALGAYPAARGTRALLAGLQGGPARQARRRIDRYVARNPAVALRIYRTPAGYRVLATHRPYDPLEPETTSLFQALGVDPVYARMCRNQACFRARVTPKPWRIGIERHLRPRPGVWPINPDRLPERRAWVAAYEIQARGFAACRHEASVGAGVVHPAVLATLRWHDELSRAGEPLPIA